MFNRSLHYTLKEVSVNDRSHSVQGAKIFLVMDSFRV
jgi:hypothetical protein